MANIKITNLPTATVLDGSDVGPFVNSGVTKKATVNLIVETGLASVAANDIKPTESIIVACSNETSALTVGTAKVTFRMPYAFTLTSIRASLTTAQTSGAVFTVDVNQGGTSILSTKLTIDNGEKTSVTAATPPVITTSALLDDASMTVDIDQIGDGTATGLKVTLIGHR